MKRNYKLRSKIKKELEIDLNGLEIHHTTPIFDNGTDDISNLEFLTPEEHSNEHLKRYKKYGDFRDLCAYYMINYNFTEAHKISSSIGGKIGGNITKNKKIGICTEDQEQRKEWASLGGKVGGNVQKEKKIGIHGATKEQRKEWGTLGGKTSGIFKNKLFQSEMGKRGGIKNKGFVWITNDEIEMKYTKVMQENQDIESFLKENQDFRKGRKNNENKKNKKV